MKKKLTYISPIDVGKVTGALGMLYSLFVTALFFAGVAIGMVTGNYHGLGVASPDAIVILILVPIVGFVYGALGAAVYNLVAKWTGGIRYTVSEIAPAVVPPWPQALPRYPFAPR
jgi:hypothetical protein